MDHDPPRLTPRRKLPPMGALAFTFLGLSFIGWIWSGNWRWLVTGAVLLIICAVIDAAKR